MMRCSTFLVYLGAASLSISEIEANAIGNYPSTTSDSLVDSNFEKLQDIAAQCIDTKIMNGEDMITNALEKFEDYCTDTQTSKFESALLDYNDCTDTNFADFIETLWDASLGMTLTCASYFYKHGPALLVEITAGNISEMPFREHMPPECVDSLLGRNAFGDFLREHTIHPKKDAKCLAKLGLKVPDCTLRRWPVPIPGSALKSYSCMSNKVQQELDVCKAEVEALKCLPDVSYFKKLSDAEQDAECQKLARTCTIDRFNAGKVPSMIMFLPPPLSAQPLPDICDDDLSHDASTRLKAYQMVCFSEEDRNIWTSGERGTANVPLTDAVQKVKAAQKSTEQSSTRDMKSSSSSGFGVFLFGLIAGIVCTVLVGIFKQRSRDSGGTWQDVRVGHGQTLT